MIVSYADHGQFHHIVVRPITEEIRQWIREQATGSWNINGDLFNGFLVFYSRRDALNFLLRWS